MTRTTAPEIAATIRDLPTSAALDLLWQIAGHFVSYAELERDRLVRMVDEARAAA